MFTGRRRDEIWKYYSEVSSDTNGLKKSKRAKCKRCNTEIIALVARMKNHYYNTCSIINIDSTLQSKLIIILNFKVLNVNKINILNY